MLYPRALAEMRRVLKRDGVAVLLTLEKGLVSYAYLSTIIIPSPSSLMLHSDGRHFERETRPWLAQSAACYPERGVLGVPGEDSSRDWRIRSLDIRSKAGAKKQCPCQAGRE